MSKKIYISGAITGTSDYMERFAEAEKMLAKSGYEVVNPARVNAQLPKNTSHDEYMEMSFCMLKMCDIIYMLDGWKDSHGAGLEHEKALEEHIPIWYQEEREQKSEPENKKAKESAFEMIIEGIDRSIPKKVKQKGIFKNCPVCKDTVVYGMNYCSACGQKLEF